MNKDKLLIWGCGGMGREVAALCDILGREVAGFLDERPEMNGQVVEGIPVFGDLKSFEKYREEFAVVCAGVGDPHLKKKFANITASQGFRLSEALVHPSVHIPENTELGLNCILCAGSIVSIHVRIGSFVIVNTNVTLAHDVSVASYATISPGVNVSGNVQIEEGVFLGTGSSIREKVKIGAWSVIGGGAFVRSDVPPQMLYAGVPAVFKKAIVRPKG
ncbi:acetyltransferase [Cohnella zeiphila]|uniref:Acetyltransferase n=1 Tax=Cohnella zeiphila TaxID=2761120 RepID=A0A7X0SQX5_9BACL|nr:acetyltransferase [Cohnella zeiphila]MBB6734522.1 acetyltransferase [Cohnella zeiphila]